MNTKTPIEVTAAFQHVKEFFPDVSMMIVTRQGEWVFVEDNFNVPEFSTDINTSKLDAAVDAVYNQFGFPYIYEQPSFEIGDAVEVPEPNESDLHNHSFVGAVINFRGSCVVVEDGEGNCFDIEEHRLTLAE